MSTEQETTTTLAGLGNTAQAGKKGTEYRELRIQTDGSSVANSFPVSLETGRGTVQEIRVAYFENLTDPTLVFGSPPFVFWRKGQVQMQTEIRFISGFALSTSYLLRLAIEYA